MPTAAGVHRHIATAETLPATDAKLFSGRKSESAGKQQLMSVSRRTGGLGQVGLTRGARFQATSEHPDSISERQDSFLGDAQRFGVGQLHESSRNPRRRLGHDEAPLFHVQARAAEALHARTITVVSAADVYPRPYRVTVPLRSAHAPDVGLPYSGQAPVARSKPRALARSMIALTPP